MLRELEKWAMPVAVLGVWLNLADTYFTIQLLDHGFTEQNPFMAYLIDLDIVIFALFKIGIIGPAFMWTGYFSDRNRGILAGLYSAVLVYAIVVAYSTFLLWRLQ